MVLTSIVEFEFGGLSFIRVDAVLLRQLMAVCSRVSFDRNLLFALCSLLSVSPSDWSNWLLRQPYLEMNL